MTASPPIPHTAPFAEDEIEILNRVVGVASPTQRAWLAGFLAGIDASAGATAQPAAAAKPSEPLTVLYASESGNTERLAADVAKAARKQGLKPALVDMADFDVADLGKTKRLIVIASTWGEGEPPPRAQRAFKDIMGDAAPRIENVEFGVLALGDTAYVQFCAIGKALDERLEALGGKRAVDRVDCDLDFNDPASQWISSALARLAPPADARGRVIEVDFSARDFGSRPAVNLDIVEAEVSDLINLNSSRSAKETFHIELTFDGEAPAYHPGDSLDLYAQNDPVYVDALLNAAGLSADETLRGEFLKSRDITTLSLKTVENYAASTGHQYVKAFLESGEARDWIAGRQLIDLISHFPIALTPDQLRGFTRPLAPRAYSIASSRNEVGNEAHLLISAVRFESYGRARKGVASSYAAERLKKGDRVRVKLRPNRHFALPGADRDVIMVGPGTGIAPFRAFVQERRATQAPGRNWLFFGDRQYTHDFLYQLEWQDALKDGALTRMDLAFSRDTPEKIYVQNKLWDRRQDLVDWLEKGAYFYVCGDAKAMAKDVRATMVRAFADVKGVPAAAAEQNLAEIERAGRYLQDVY